MSFYYPHDAISSHSDRYRSSVERRRNVYDVRTITSALDSVKSKTPEMVIHYLSPRNIPESLEDLHNRQINHKGSPSNSHEQHHSKQTNSRGSSRNLPESLGELESQHISQKTLEVQMQDGKVDEQLQNSCEFSSQTEEEQQKQTNKLLCQKRQRKLRKRHQGFSDLQQLDEENDTIVECEASEQKQANQKSEEFQGITVQDLLEQCQDQFTVINTCTILQQMITDEIAKQGKLDDAICQKLTFKVQRLQQQRVFLEKVQAPKWVSAALDDLATQIAQRAQIYKTDAQNLIERCKEIQRSLDSHHEIMLTEVTGVQDTQHASMPEKKSQSEDSKVALPISQNPDSAEDTKPQSMTFPQTGNAFEDIRKPWLTLLSLLEYQQEQYDATVARVNQVETEIETLSKNDESEGILWRTQLHIKDLETRKELMEARRDHLLTELNCAKKELSDFELKNRDSIVDILIRIRQHSERYDTNLKQNFELLKSACLGDPVCLKSHYEMSNSGKTVKGVQKPSMISSSPDSESSPLEEDAANMNCCDGVTTEAHPKRMNNLGLKNEQTNTINKRKVNFQIERPAPRGASFLTHEFHYPSMFSLDSRNYYGYNKTNTSNTYVYKFMADKYINRYGASSTDSFRSMPDFNSHANRAFTVTKAHDIFAKDDFSEVDFGCNKCSSNAEWGSTNQAEQSLHTMPLCKCQFKDKKETAIKSREDQENVDIYDPCYLNCCEREDTSGVARKCIQHRSFDNNLEKDENYKFQCFFTEQSMGDILSDKERRLAYFISKYAGRRHNARAYLVKNLNGTRPLSWCSMNNECVLGEEVSSQKMNEHDNYCEHTKLDVEEETNNSEELAGLDSG